MYEIQLINMVRSLERKLEIEKEKQGTRVHLGFSENPMIFERCRYELNLLFDKVRECRQSRCGIQYSLNNAAMTRR